MNRVGKMVNFLVPIQREDVFNLGVASPKQVETIALLQQLKPISLHCVHDSVIHVGPIRNQERHEQRFNVVAFTIVDLDQAHVESLVQIHVLRVQEEDCWSASFKQWLHKTNVIS